MDFKLQRVARLTSFEEQERERPSLRYRLSRPAEERIAAVEFLRRQFDGPRVRLRRIHRLLTRTSFMKWRATQPILLHAETPRVDDAFCVGHSHPELKIVPVGIRG